MSEKELREGLVGAVANEPPLDFDPDRLLARAQREARRRRSLVGVGAATAVIAVAAATTATVLHPADEAAPAAHLTTGPGTQTPHVTTGPVHSLAAWPPPVREYHYTAARENELAAAWTSHIKTTFGQIVPNAGNVAVRPWGGEAEGSVSADQDYLDAFVTFTVDGTPTAVDISVFAPGQNSTGPQGDCKNPCAATPLPDGSVLTVDPYSQNSVHLLTVSQYRPDGSVVSATGYNYDPTGKSSPGYSAAVLLNIQQLTSFATDHAFEFTP
ncbi:MAG TPA: hypothetical protein VH333_13365 [Pseudonocardiaceae bacterium]|jgi:hypothetical protein|nr:hypothetical protein [Pseudonocardiaceae bacterium]